MKITNQGGLKDLDLDISYIGTDQVLNSFLLPCLTKSKKYSRLTGYFSVDSFLNISQGLETIWKNAGTMRLVIGIHDVDFRLIQAKNLSDEEAEEIYSRVQNNLLETVASITTELEKDKLSTLVWMLRSGLLEVKVAIVKGPLAEGIFHVKRFVFEDTIGNMVTGSGSPNETRPGQIGNFEDVTVHMSWGPDPRYADKLSSQFEQIWLNKTPDLKVVELYEDFLEKLLVKIERVPIPPLEQKFTPALELILSHAKNSPSFAHLTYPGAVLFPHQERALKQATNSNPIRVLLADEVGLGKTLEAGSIIDFSIRFREVKEVCILTPASILKQFQDELAEFFGLNFYVWNSSTKKYVDSKGLEHAESISGPMDQGRPNLTMISYQLARGSKKVDSIFKNLESLPEMLVVDEAHAARIHAEDTGERPTVLWKALDEIRRPIKHLVLMTATPLQVHPLEFHGLLRLLGLPAAWEKAENYLRSLSLLASESTAINLEDAILVSNLIESALTLSQTGLELLSEEEKQLIATLKGIEDGDNTKKGILVRRSFSTFVGVLAKVHPVHCLVIRNTRRSLESIGYSFPEREFVAPELNQTFQIRNFIIELEDYLERGFGLVESALNPKYAKSLGFVKVSYQQRLASSLNSCNLSLNRRLSKILALEEGKATILQEEEDLDDSDDNDQEVLASDLSTSDIDIQALEAFTHAATVEKAYLKGLLRKLTELDSGFIDGDLKFKGAGKVLNEHRKKTKLLVFSRYTDTLDGFVQFLKNNHPEILEDGVGYYSGGDVWITEGRTNKRVKSTKSEIRKSLDSGRIRIVLCSDAASEGLNLQSAEILVNLDVPWNPARLEQRIGRIARLGQKAKTVKVFNFWYPESVEAKMYSRLLQRRDLYELAVGEFPNIFAQAIRSNARVQAQVGTNFDLDAMNELEEARKAVQSKALAKVWGSQNSSMSISSKIVQDWDELVSTFVREDVNYVAPNPITLGNINTRNYIFQVPQVCNPSVEVFASRRNNVVLGFVLKSENQYAILKTEAIVNLMQASLGNLALTENDIAFGWFGEEELARRLSIGDFSVFGGPQSARVSNKDLITDIFDSEISFSQLDLIPISRVSISQIKL